MSTSLDTRVAQEVRAELARQMHSKRWMATALGEPPSTVNRWLNGQTAISLSDLDSMCRVLNVTIADLLSRISDDAPARTGVQTGGSMSCGQGQRRGSLE